MREIKFSLSEGRYISDTFAATGTSMAVRVEFEKAGSCTLMKSIDTGKFVPSAALLDLVRLLPVAVELPGVRCQHDALMPDCV